MWDPCADGDWVSGGRWYPFVYAMRARNYIRTTMPVHPINATFAMVAFFGIIQVEGCECQ
jgi:hypothetical protein